MVESGDRLGDMTSELMAWNIFQNMLVGSEELCVQNAQYRDWRGGNSV